MSHRGKSHLVIMFTVGPDDVAEGDRIFASHGEWMKGHPREDRRQKHGRDRAAFEDPRAHVAARAM
jgi:hypothetical protein